MKRRRERALATLLEAATVTERDPACVPLVNSAAPSPRRCASTSGSTHVC